MKKEEGVQARGCAERDYCTATVSLIAFVL